MQMKNAECKIALLVVLMLLFSGACAGGLPAPAPGWTITGAADYPAFRDAMTDFKWLVGGGMSLLAGLMVVIWNSLLSRISSERKDDKERHEEQMKAWREMCDYKHEVVDKIHEELAEELSLCCPHRTERVGS